MFALLRKQLWWLTLGLVVLDAVLAVAWLALPRLEIPLDPAQIQLNQDQAYTIPIQPRLQFLLTVHSDTANSSGRSGLQLQEAGTKLGPAHTLHDRIRAKGKGGFSHWDGHLLFSTSDLSDPRSNGRKYVASVPLAFSRKITWPWLGLNLVFLALFFGEICSWVRARPTQLATGIGLALVALLALAAVGILGPLNPGGGTPKDGPLLLAILWHLLYGLAYTAILLATGAGLFLALTRRWHASLEQLLFLGFPLGLVGFMGIALAAVKTPVGAWAWCGLVPALLPILHWQNKKVACQRIAFPLLQVFPFIALFAVGMGMMWHGPTETMPSSTMGDTVLWVGLSLTTGTHIYPMPNFGVEGGTLPYGHMPVPIFMASLKDLPGFEPFLWLSVVGPTFFMTSLFLGLHFIRARQNRGLPLPTSLAGLVILLALTACRYPSWTVESGPVPFLGLLVMSIYFMKREAATLPWSQEATVLLAIVSSAFSKVVSLTVYFPFLVFDTLPTYFSGLSRKKMWTLLGVSALTGVYVVWVVGAYLQMCYYCGRFGPDSLRGLFSGDSATLQMFLPILSRDLGLVFLGVGVFRLGVKELTLGVVPALVAYFFLPWVFYTVYPTALFLTLPALLDRPEGWSRARGWLFAGGLCLLPYPLLSDLGGWQVSLLWCVGVGMTTWLAVNPPSLEGSWNLLGPLQNRISWTAAAVLGMGLVATATGGLVISSGNPEEFTPVHRDIWLALRDHTPPDALIFTDQTGPTEDHLGGWNDFAMLSQRQFFLSSWSYHPMRWNPPEREARLDQNDAVLKGREAPERMTLSRAYSSYFAVMSHERSAPPHFVRVYGNSMFGVYRIPTAPTGPREAAADSVATTDWRAVGGRPLILSPP